MGITRPVSPPTSTAELMQRCQQLAGKTVASVAAELGWTVPENLSQHKGWLGQLLECYLGADAGNQAEPDFTRLGIELKTLPLDANGRPKESTYVCTVSLTGQAAMHWRDSWVRRKLSHVLWLPVEADPAIPLAERYIGLGWLWQPNEQQMQILQQDWEELMDRLLQGEQAELSAREGQFLQIRPKAAHSRIMARSIDSDGVADFSNPRGFYLRTTFTSDLLINQK